MMTKHSAAHYFLEGLVDLGIDYIFANLGTDHVSIIEELARWDREGRPHPKILLCPHENVAVHMAGAYALATGRGQAVLVHVDAGTANAAMAMHNLFRARIPVLLMAGKAPFTTHGELLGSRDSYVHFVQDPFDMASIVRSYVKWEYCLPSGVVAKEALRRAQSFMQSDPPGPVFMLLPRETLAEDLEEGAVPAYPAEKYGPMKLGGIDAARVAAIGDALMKAQNPIAITAYLGRNPRAVALLDALARACGIRVAQYGPIDMNVPHDSPCFAGFDPGTVMADADLGVLLDVDVPFIPLVAKGADKIRWLQIDIDPIKSGFPMWGFAAEMRVQADCATVLAQVLDYVRGKADAAFEARVAARLDNFGPARRARADRIAAAADKRGTIDAITPDYLCALLNAKLSADDIIVSEAIRNINPVLDQIRRTKPGTYVANAGGGLGHSGGTALGLKLANPHVRVVQIVGDGSFHFSTPDSVYAVAQQYDLPIFSVVLDNGGWQAVKAATQRVYPKGEAAAANAFQSRLVSGRQGEQRRLEDIGRAFGAHGESVGDPDALPAAIDRCLAALADGRAAVLTVRITPL